MKKIVTLILVSHIASFYGGYYVKENFMFQSPIVWKGVEIDNSKPDIAEVGEKFPKSNKKIVKNSVDDKQQFEMIVSNIYAEDVSEILAKPIK